MQIYADIQQGTIEWLRVRMGIPTASCFHEVMMKPGPRGGLPKGRITYMHKLAGEILTDEPMDSYVGFSMQRGKNDEDSARKYYAMVTDIEPQQVAFIKNGNCGCSPDSLIGTNGMFETKSAAAHIQIERLQNKDVPNEHFAQCQGGLMVAEREWIDFMSYCPRLPPFIKRVYRDERFIAELRIDINDFVDELNDLVERIRSM